MKNSDYINYLSDVYTLLYQRGIAAKQEYLRQRSIEDVKAIAFSDGYVVGHYHCLEVLLNQAVAFGIPIDQISAGLDPKELMTTE